MDNVLEQYLLTVLQPQPGSDDKLFGSNGPLRDTYAKINIAYRLGIIDTDVERALQLVIPFRFVDGIMGICRRYTTHR